MAAIADTQVTSIYSEGSGEKTALFRISNVTTADTYNFSASFKKLKFAVWGPAGDLTTGVVGAVSGGPPATIVTFTLASLANDTIYVLVTGQNV